MEYNELTKDQKEYLRQLNGIRATLSNVAYNLQQQVANLTSDLIENETPRESVWNAREDAGPAQTLQGRLKDAHSRLEQDAERLEVIRQIVVENYHDLRYRFRELDPTVWKSRLNGSEEQPEPARDAAEEIYCERNED